MLVAHSIVYFYTIISKSSLYKMKQNEKRKQTPRFDEWYLFQIESLDLMIEKWQYWKIISDSTLNLEKQDLDYKDLIFDKCR